MMWHKRMKKYWTRWHCLLCRSGARLIDYVLVWEEKSEVKRDICFPWEKSFENRKKGDCIFFQDSTNLDHSDKRATYITKVWPCAEIMLHVKSFSETLTPSLWSSLRKRALRRKKVNICGIISSWGSSPFQLSGSPFLILKAFHQRPPCDMCWLSCKRDLTHFTRLQALPHQSHCNVECLPRFVKIHAPMEVVKQYAEILNMRMKLKVSYS